MSGELVLVANARLPSQRAQSLQVVQMASAFARTGCRTTLLHALRHPTPPLPPGQDLFEFYGVPAGARPEVVGVPCTDWIDRVPTRLQFVPARVQELSFARNAADRVRRDHADAWVLSREIETARALTADARGAASVVFLEIHRVPGGRVRRRWLREAAARARGVVAISGGVKQDLVRLGLAGESILVEHDAMERSRFSCEVARSSARKSLRLDQKAPVVVYTGGLMGWKGVDLLIDAARVLPDVSFVIAGGMEQDVLRLRKYARRVWNVRFDGFQPPDRIPLYLAAADVGVVPNRSRPAISAKYTSPLKVFESMAMGLPLVASDLPSLREILVGEEHAVFVAPDDPAALAEGIGRLFGDEALREAMRAHGIARAPELTWDARAERILAWMRQRAGARPAVTTPS
jgi:glycosyltransferase involved in cell wall biosynthesis